MRQSRMTMSAACPELLVKEWQSRLGLADWEGRLVRLSAQQVTGEDGTPGAELVGVVTDLKSFTILHTRPLAEDDVVHELLHVRFPRWPHRYVEVWTDYLSDDPSHLPRLWEFATSQEREEHNMSESTKQYKAFNLRTRQECTILNPEIVTMKNGRKAVQGLASDDQKTKVFRILGAAEADKLE